MGCAGNLGAYNSDYDPKKYAYLSQTHKQKAMNLLSGLTTKKKLTVTHLSRGVKVKNQQLCKLLILLVPPARIELAAPGLGIRCSIH